jgi:hypothetical protein
MELQIGFPTTTRNNARIYSGKTDRATTIFEFQFLLGRSFSDTRCFSAPTQGRKWEENGDIVGGGEHCMDTARLQMSVGLVERIKWYVWPCALYGLAVGV